MVFPRGWIRPLGAVLALATGLVAGPGLGGSPAAAQQAGYGQTMGTSTQERQIYGGNGSSPSGSPIDSKNPIDLINRLRRSTALDDATPPASAVDQALKALEQQGSPQPATVASPAASLKGP